MQLLQTTIYMIGLHCALRGGVEHNNLRRPGCNSQFSFEVDGNGVERLVYREDPLQKNNQGSLICKSKPKIVNVYAASNKAKCPIAIFKKYCGLLPQSKSCKKLYLRCRKYPVPSVWYCDQPYGINKINANVKEICKEGGIMCNFTNHSLRATCVSRMYDQNVPEQIIKQVTGHRSDCVRVNKRTGDNLKRAASGVIAGEVSSKKVKLDEEVNEKGEQCVKSEANVTKSPLSYNKMLKNVIKTRGELRIKKYFKTKVRAQRLVSKAKKVTKDVNLNMNLTK